MSALVPLVHFGGPDLPPGRLRDVLAERVAAVPSGGAIDWVTYYFRDRRLAGELVRAHERGVRVRVAVEGHPRTPHANDAVAALLSASLGDGFHAARSAMDAGPWRKLWRPRLHEKLYCFSGPEPAAFIGSFNPSGDVPEEDPDTLRAIGDQDRGHNALVELRDPAIVEALVAHARQLHGSWHGPLDRFARSASRPVCGRGIEIHFLPRVGPHPVAARLDALGAGSRARVAASHLSGPSSLSTLTRAARRGVALEIVAEATHRRVPPGVEERLREAGATVYRYAVTSQSGHPEGEAGLPMHAKFVLADGPGERWLAFGSFNWTESSRRFSHEIAALSSDSSLWETFDERWERLLEGAAGGAAPGMGPR